MGKIKISDIRKELEKDNWNICSKEYVNLDSELVFLCNEGHEVYSTWRKIRNRKDCPICKKNNYIVKAIKIKPKDINKKRILALDQASHVTGWAIYDENILVQSGVFEVEDKQDEIERDTDIKNWLINMINNYNPDIVGIEDIQLQNINGNLGVKTYKVLAHLQGILMQTLFELKVEYRLCPPGTWRSACGVKGTSKTDMKKSMQLLVKKWYDVTVTNDEADAIGIGKYLSDIIKKEKTIINWE